VVDHSWRPHQYSETEHQLFNFIQFNETSHHQLGFVGPDEQGGQDVQNQSSLNGDKGKNQLGHKKEFPNNTANEDQRTNDDENKLKEQGDNGREKQFSFIQFKSVHKNVKKRKKLQNEHKKEIENNTPKKHLRNKADDKKVKDEGHRGRENQFNFIQFKHEDEHEKNIQNITAKNEVNKKGDEIGDVYKSEEEQTKKKLKNETTEGEITHLEMGPGEEKDGHETGPEGEKEELLEETKKGKPNKFAPGKGIEDYMEDKDDSNMDDIKHNFDYLQGMEPKEEKDDSNMHKH